MTVGFVMLAHASLDRAGQVARHLSESGAPVVVHIDRRVSDADFRRFKSKMQDYPDARFSERVTCEWGTWSIVEATQKAAQLLLDEFEHVDRVFLISGTCLPLRSIAELQAYLEAHPGTDFIESVTADEVDWPLGGLHYERFTLRFPFSWRKSRKLFDRYVQFQRRFGVQRTLPKNISPHLGSQWWCLTRETLTAIFNAQDREDIDRFFRRVWIPDESYFQTLVRQHATRIESRSLTQSKFDIQGKPHVFYDDHLALLEDSQCFFARKIWPRAEKLYRRFLDPAKSAVSTAEPNPLDIERLFSRSTERSMRGRAGLHMQSRFPPYGWSNGATAAPYMVLQGFSHLFEDFENWLDGATDLRAHGRLFASDRAHFAGGEKTFSGCLSDDSRLRDYNHQAFLTNLIWNTKGLSQCFQFDPADNQNISWFLAADQNAHIGIISGAWAIPLFRSDVPFPEMRKQAAHLQRTEDNFLRLLSDGSYTKARVKVWSLAEFIEDPNTNIEAMFADHLIQTEHLKLPEMADLIGFGSFLQKLRNEGMSPHVMGDFRVADGEVIVAVPPKKSGS
ncbi:DUF5927 domain-containing protein [Litoreibacter roseus]|nr:beta-1,6-N-acetylglucosaminyltransferase [Litoreibacter roseus]